MILHNDDCIEVCVGRMVQHVGRTLSPALNLLTRADDDCIYKETLAWIIAILP